MWKQRLKLDRIQKKMKAHRGVTVRPSHPVDRDDLGFTHNQSQAQESSIAPEHATSSIVREDSMGTFVFLTGGEQQYLYFKLKRTEDATMAAIYGMEWNGPSPFSKWGLISPTRLVLGAC